MRHQAKSSSVMRSGDEFRKLLQIRLGQARPRVTGNTWMRVPRIENRWSARAGLRKLAWLGRMAVLNARWVHGRMRRLARACRLALALTLPWPVAAGETVSWPQWQTILYQPTTPAALASLHAIGINAGQVIADRNDVAPAAIGPAIAPFLDQHMRWYVENIASDFYAAYHRWQPDAPVNAAFLQAEARHRRNPGDLAAFIRRPSLCDPAWRAKIAARLQRVVGEFRPYQPLY
jgi:hypothetical protein